ncbi:MAG: UDP-3-O-(3-hydroxymyristoyl)glucosamine N-acyltransferase [Bacilli bacterium]
MIEITVHDIGEFLGVDCLDNLIINCCSTLDEMKENSVCFSKNYSQDIVDKTKDRNILIIACEEYKDKLLCPYILSKNPRLDYIKIVNKFFRKKEVYAIDKTAVVLSNVNDVKIGPFSYIEKGVTIGKHSIIESNVIIKENTDIGENCIIKAGAVIGGSGFGYEFDESGIPHQFYHTGNVKIGNNVHIGSNTCIDKGTLGSTKINDNVKIDNLVHVAHNCLIEENTLVIAGAELSGGVHLGKNVWVGPNSCIREKLYIGNNALIGIGSVVVKNIESNNVYAGNPAKLLKTNN